MDTPLYALGSNAETGLCLCGCGQITPIYTKTKRGIKKGQHVSFIQGHQQRLVNKLPKKRNSGESHYKWNGGISRSAGYTLVRAQDHPNSDTWGYKQQHVLIAEKAIGKLLNPPALVHHVDQNKSNNTNSNLVVCQDQAYHMLIHQRTRAYRACGYADWIKCVYCKKYSPPEEMIICAGKYPRGRHSECKALRNR